MKKLCFLLSLLMVIMVTACHGGTGQQEEKTTEFVIVEEEVPTFEIDSIVGKLQYPQKWENQIRVEENENQLIFWGKVEGKEEKLLFTLEFNESDGYLLGTLDDTKIYIVDAEDDFDESWSEAEKLQIRAMQEDVNVILKGLLEMDNFTLAK